MNLNYKNINYTLLGCLAFIFIQSCSFNEFENSNRIVDISNEIELKLLPSLDNAQELKWYIGTKEQTYCNEAFIETQLIEKQGGQDLLLKGIITPSFCEILDSRLISMESFEMQDEIGVNIEFTDELQSFINLEKQNNNIIITHTEEDYFSFDQKQLKFFDQLTIWTGFSSTSSFDLNDLQDEFSDLIQENPITSLPAGDYGYISMNDKDLEVLHPKTFEKYEENFIFQLSGEVDYEVIATKLLEISHKIRSIHNDLDFFIATSKGDVF